MKMDTTYSLLLAASLVSGGSALAGALWSRLQRLPQRLDRIIWLLAILALLFDVMSFVVHLAFGHTPGTETAMAALEFVREHPAFIVALLPGMLALRLRHR